MQQEKKKKERELNAIRKQSLAKEKEDEEKAANRKLEAEISHQKEEAERKALAQAVKADAAGNRPTFNQSCLKLLVNYQGNKTSFI